MSNSNPGAANASDETLTPEEREEVANLPPVDVEHVRLAGGEETAEQGEGEAKGGGSEARGEGGRATAERKRRQAQKLKELEANGRKTDDAVAPSGSTSASVGGAADAAPAPPSKHEDQRKIRAATAKGTAIDSDTAVPSTTPSPPPEGGTTEQQKRAAIQLVMKDKSLSPQERQLAIQKIIKGDFKVLGLQQQKQAPRAEAVDVLGEDAVRKLDNGKGGEVPVMDSSSESGSSEEESSEEESSEEESGSSEEEESSEEGEEYETDEGSSGEEDGDEWLSSSSYETEETVSGNETGNNDIVSKVVEQAAALHNNNTGSVENVDTLEARGSAETELIDGSLSDSSSYRNPKRRSSLGVGSEFTIPEAEKQQQWQQESPYQHQEMAAAVVDATSEVEPNARSELAAKESVRELEAQLDQELANHSGELESEQKALLYANVRNQSQLERERHVKVEAQLDAELENQADLEREQRERESEFGRRAAIAAEEEKMQHEAKLQALAKEWSLRAATEESSGRLIAQQVRERDERTLWEEAKADREPQFQLRTPDSAEEEYLLQQERLREEKEKSRTLANVQVEREEQLHAMSKEQGQRTATEESSRRLQAATGRKELTALFWEEVEQRNEQRREQALREEAEQRRDRESQFQLRTTDSAEEEYLLQQEQLRKEKERSQALAKVQEEREEQLLAMSKEQEQRAATEESSRRLQAVREQEELAARILQEEAEQRNEQRRLREEESRRLQEAGDAERARLLALRKEAEHEEQLRLQEEREREEGRIRALREETEREQHRIHELREERKRQEREHREREEQRLLRAEGEREQIRLQEEREREEQRLLVLREETERRVALREEREREEGRLRALQEERERHERLAQEEQQRLQADQERLREERETEERRLREQRELHQRLERERIQRSREEEEQRGFQHQQRTQEEIHVTRTIAPRGSSQHHRPTSHRASKTLANRQSGESGMSSTALAEASGSIPRTSFSRANTQQMRSSRYDGVDDDELNWRLDSYASLSDFTIVVHRARPGPYAPNFDTADVCRIDFVMDPSNSSSSRPKRDVYYAHKAMIAVGSRRSELLGRRIRDAENSSSIDDRPSDANVHETVMLESAANAMGAVLDFLYYPDRSLEIDATNAVPLVYLGKRYRIRALSELAELYVMDNIESATAMYFLLDSYLYQLDEILGRAIDVTAANLGETVDFGPIYRLPPELFRRVVLSKELNCDSELLSLIVYSYCGEHHSEDIDVEYFRELTKPRIMPDIDPKVSLMVLKFYVDLVLGDDENCEIMEALQGDSLSDRCIAVVAKHWQGEVCEPMMVDAEWADNSTPRARATPTSHHEPAALHRSLPPKLQSHLLEQCILEAKGNVDAEKDVARNFEGQKKAELENNAKSFGHIVKELQAELEKSNKSRVNESREYLTQIEQLQHKAAELEAQLDRKAKDLEEYKQELRHFRRVPGIHSFGRVSEDDPGIIDKTTCTYSANPDHHYPNHRRGNRRPTQMPDKGKDIENLGKENGYVYDDGKGGLLPVYYYHKKSGGGGKGGAVEC
eukprot:CAMPEP_0181111688 /NCGR_PEP_ID=MMETSP1071-20121207/19406_1 /TAXON_ID=35127 /ORGANISM="Thalassiosira sp., Strain NH16" /LENGTH=1546 /DNA_ID=CAMNT_0023195593 /DNA_START=42 /DNA_END=4683 /DNA_ORIENTATION=+